MVNTEKKPEEETKNNNTISEEEEETRRDQSFPYIHSCGCYIHSCGCLFPKNRTMVNIEKKPEETKNNNTINTISEEEEETRRDQEEEDLDLFLKEYDLVNYLRLRTSELSTTTTIFPLLVSANGLCEKNDHLSFTDFSNYESYYLHLPETKNMRFCGSSEGWLIMVSNTVGLARIFLFQPFSRAFIELPQGSNSPIIPERYSSSSTNRPAAVATTAPYFIRKAILSSSPSVSNQDWAVAAIDSSGKLFFYYHDVRNQLLQSNNNNYWTSSKEDDYEACGGRVRTFEDVMFFDGRFYALQTNGFVTAYNIHGFESSPTLNFIGGYETGFTNYLVEAKGEFFMVSRMCSDNAYVGFGGAYTTHKFNVFRLEARWRGIWRGTPRSTGIKGSGKWVKVEDTKQFLGDQVLFLGAGCSKSVNVVDCPGYKANHIYFSDDNFHRYYDLGMQFMCDDNGEYKLSPNTIAELSMETGGGCSHRLSQNTISPASPPLWFHAYPLMMINP